MNLIAAVGQNLEMGFNRGLPWHLPNEVSMYLEMVRGCPPPVAGKRNVALMGRKTWFSKDREREDYFDQLAHTIQIVLSRTLTEVPKGADYLFSSFEDALEFLSQSDQRERIHDVWNIGGHDLYKAALESPAFHRLYLTRVYGEFEHDAKFPEIDFSQFRSIRDERLPQGIQEENGIKYEYFVYEKNAGTS